MSFKSGDGDATTTQLDAARYGTSLRADGVGRAGAQGAGALRITGVSQHRDVEVVLLGLLAIYTRVQPGASAEEALQAQRMLICMLRFILC